MRRLRDLLSVVALIGLTAVSLWGAVLVAQQKFPGPDALQPLDVQEWLTQRDLSQATKQQRSRIVRRLEEQVLAGERPREQKLNPEQRQQLMQNLSPLFEQWFRDKSEQYLTQPADVRDAWLDQEIAQLERLIPRGEGQAASAKQTAGSLYVLGLIGAEMEKWIQRADPEEQSRLREFQQALSRRLFAVHRRNAG